MHSSTLSHLPLVSVVVPAYNAEAYIEHTLHSLLSQEYPNLEIIVVDDGSVDGTLERVHAVANRHPRIRIIQQANSGVAAARNRGIDAARGEFIAPVDADDIWFPRAAERLVDCLLSAEQRVGVAYAWWVAIDDDGLLNGSFHSSTIEGDVLGTLVCHNFLGNASSTMIRRECFQRIGGYDCQFRVQGRQGCEDWDLYVRLAAQYHFRVVPDFLVGYRKSRTSMSSNASSMAASHRHMLQKVRQQHPGIPRLFCRMSLSSFYIFLAHDCRRQNRTRQSWYWLLEALRRAPVFTICRPALYRLIIQNTASLVPRPPRLLPRYCRSGRAGEERGMRARPQIVQVGDIKRQRVRIRLMNLCQTLLQRILLRSGMAWRFALRAYSCKDAGGDFTLIPRNSTMQKASPQLPQRRRSSEL